MMFTSVYFLTVCMLLLIGLARSALGPLDQTLLWDFVKHIPLTSAEIDKCPVLCKSEPSCMSWTVEKALPLPMENTTLVGAMFDCFLLSEDMMKIRVLLPEMASNKTHISGYKLSAEPTNPHSTAKTDIGVTSGDLSSSKGAEKSNNIQFQTLLTGPLATDTSTLLNYPQHFVSHCAYTISMWVWIYRPRTELNDRDRAEKVIFAAKEIHPRLTAHTTLLPSIIYNVAPHPGKFFFSMVRGVHDSDYLGFHRGEVKYHQWIHLSVTIQPDGTMGAYQDGVLLDTLRYGPRDIKPSSVQHCVYDHNMQTKTRKARATSPHSASASTSTSSAVSTAHSGAKPVNKIFTKSASASYFENIVHNPWEAHVNNSILYVAGRMHHRGVHNTIGMVQNLHIVRNFALNQGQIRTLMTHRPPPHMPALQKLLRNYRIPSLQDFTPIELADDFYRSWEWGLCPELVCGKICIDENIYVTDDVNTVEILRQSESVGEKLGFVEPINVSENENTTEGTLTADDTDNASSSKTGRVSVRSVVSGKVLQDIGYPSDTAVYRATLLKTIRAHANNSLFDTILPAEEETVQQGIAAFLYDYVVPFVLNPMESILYHLQFLLETTERTLYGLPLYDADYLTELANEQKLANRPLITKNMTSYEHYVYKQMINAQYYTQTREGKVQGLYKRAMNILNDRYIVEETSSNQFTTEQNTKPTNSAGAAATSGADTSYSTSAQISQDFNAWRATQMESAHAALFLALWLAEDIPQKTHPDDVFWTFKTAHLLTQPIHLALGYNTGSAYTQDYVPWEEVKSMLLLPSAVLSESGVVEEILGIEPTRHHWGSVVSSRAGTVETAEVTEGEGVFYIDHSTANPSSTESTTVAADPTPTITDRPGIQAKHEEYTFLIDENGEVVVVHHPVDTVATSTTAAAATVTVGLSPPTVSPTAMTSGSTASKTPAAQNWLKVFANLSTDDIKSALDSSLKPLASQGLTKSFLHVLIIARQIKRSESAQKRWRAEQGLHNEAEEHGENLLKASLQRHEVDQQLMQFVGASSVSNTPKNANKPVTVGAPDCRAQASYYFPITQYVAAQYGSTHSGIGLLEEVRLIVSGGVAPEGHAGEEDIIHQHTEAEAHDGNPYAQTWLAKKYFWGLGGLQRNEMLARRWFERAAAQNDPEGLYNVGIFHNNGQAGLAQNPDVALQYFHRAADHPNPFPMALHAVGNHYMYGEQKNFTRAMAYLLKAAAHRSDDAHFSLAMLYREGKGTAVDIPRSVAHLAVAASWGHVRSLNFLSHALYDADSWLMQYGREQVAVRRQKAMLNVLTRDDPVKEKTVSSSGESGAGGGADASGAGKPIVGGAKVDPLTAKLDPLDPNLFNATANSTQKSHDEARVAFTDALLRSSLVFNELELIKIYLPDGTLVPLPYPLGSPEGSCEAVLPMLKYLAEMSYRPKDLVHRALKDYIAGDYWAALSLYEEAADLGVYAAQENAAYLLEKIMPTECAKYEDYLLKEGNSDSQLSVTGTTGAAFTSASGGAYKCTNPQDCCQQYLSKLATKRWAQLAKMGEPRAMRKVADALLDPKLSHMMLPGGGHEGDGDNTSSIRISDAGTSNIALAGSTSALAAAVNATPALSARQQAALLYALAGDQGDSESLLQLGWMLYYGEQGVARNQTAAKELFETALELEAPSATADYAEQELLLEDGGDGAFGDVYGDPLLGEGGAVGGALGAGGVGGEVVAEPDLGHHAGLTDAEVREELQELSWQRHQHTRRWQTAGFASRTTQGVAPSLALAVVKTDAFLQDMGFNTSVRELTLQAEQLVAKYVPEVVQTWWSGQSASKEASAAARAEKRNSTWHRVKRVIRSTVLRLLNVLEDSNYGYLFIYVKTVLMTVMFGVVLHLLVLRFRR